MCISFKISKLVRCVLWTSFSFACMRPLGMAVIIVHMYDVWLSLPPLCRYPQPRPPSSPLAQSCLISHRQHTNTQTTNAQTDRHLQTQVYKLFCLSLFLSFARFFGLMATPLRRTTIIASQSILYHRAHTTTTVVVVSLSSLVSPLFLYLPFVRL